MMYQQLNLGSLQYQNNKTKPKIPLTLYTMYHLTAEKKTNEGIREKN